MDCTRTAADPTLAPPGYPVTRDGWVTISRTRSPYGGVLLVQKREGCTRTVHA